MKTKCSWGQSHNVAPLAPFQKKAFLSPSVWARREHIWKLSLKESLLICIENYQGVPCSHRQSRNRMMNRFIIVKITPYAINGKSMVFLFKKVFPLTSLGHSFERRAYCFVLKAARVFPIRILLAKSSKWRKYLKKLNNCTSQLFFYADCLFCPYNLRRTGRISSGIFILPVK